jgi:hypothetical protein
MKTTKKHLDDLKQILFDLQRAKDYLMRVDVAGIARVEDERYAVGSSYIIKNRVFATDNGHTVKYPACVNVMNKHIGSDIVGLYQGLSKLNEVIEQLSDK